MHSTRTWIKGVDSGNSAHVKGKLSSEIEKVDFDVRPIMSSKMAMPRVYMSLSIITSIFSRSLIYFFCFENGQ